MSQQESVSVWPALAHNNNAHRNAYLQPLFDELRTSLSRRFSARGLEVSIQPEIGPHGTPTALLRDVIYRRLAREWCRYRLLRPQLLPLNARNFLVTSLRNIRVGALEAKQFRRSRRWLRTSTYAHGAHFWRRAGIS